MLLTEIGICEADSLRAAKLKMSGPYSAHIYPSNSLSASPLPLLHGGREGTQDKTRHASSPEFCWSLASNKTNMKMALSSVLFFPYPLACAETTLACLPSALLAFGVFKVRHETGQHQNVERGTCCGGGRGSVSLLYRHKGKEAVLLLFWAGRRGSTDELEAAACQGWPTMLRF